MNNKYRIFDMQCFGQWILFSFVVRCIVLNQVLGCLEDERIALLKLKDVLNQYNRTLPPSWGDQEELDCCRWVGVICDDDDEVSKRIINLSVKSSSPWRNMQFSGEVLPFLDASLFQPFEQLQNLTLVTNTELKGLLRLTKLKVLDLRGNVMSHGFPELANLSSLELLNLGDNEYVDIPPSIWTLTSLRMLGISVNKLNGSLPEGLCALTNLEELDLSLNELEGLIPVCLSKLTSLRVLDLSKNKFSGSIPSNLFSSLKLLEYVSISDNLFEGLFSFSSFASNSKLEVFQLENNHLLKLKVETENAQWKPPVFQLKVLRLSNCILNEPTGGVIPRFLLSQYDLRVVYLNNNGMTGELPSWLLNNNSRLQALSLRNNFFNGSFMLQLGSYNAYMNLLDVSMNRVAGEIPTSIGSILPNLTYLNMSTNAIEGSIPSGFDKMRNLSVLDLSNNHLSGEITGTMFNGCEQLTILKLSNNSLGGSLTNFLPNNLGGLPRLWCLYLDNNNFYGDLTLKTSIRLTLKTSIRLTRSVLLILDISKNSFTGRFPDWIAQLSELRTLVLSKNNFEGNLPTNFCKLTNLIFLDLSWNNFSGILPPCNNLSSVRFLHLQGNGFYGPLPSSHSLLVTLDVRDNKFSGLIPASISSLSYLSVLLLKGNHFNGSIPSELCQMENLNMLNLAANNLSGFLPPCLSHIRFGTTTPDIQFDRNSEEIWRYNEPKSEYSYKNQHIGLVQYFFREEYKEAPYVREEVEYITKNVSESYTGCILYFMSGIDVSLNRLTGPIPSLDIGNWDMVHSLNISYNNFNGSIPWTLSRLKRLESLDLSHNMLSGEIPSQITELFFLAVFSVAYNNLSGPTPTTTRGQFATFDAKSYEGNPFLYGPTKKVHAKASPEVPEGNDSSFKTLFLWSFSGSYVVSCIGAFVFFYFSTNIPQTILGWMGVEMVPPPRRTTVELPWKK